MKNLLILLLCFFLFSPNSTAQQVDLVEPYEVSNPLHVQHIGKITFLEEYISLADYRAEDFVTSFELKKKANLSFRAFFANSLTNYLHPLAPELSAAELIELGNFQFSFIVDDELIYIENLNVGAGLAEAKHKNKALYGSLSSAKKKDFWGQYLWMRFLAKGGSTALDGGTHQLRIELRPYIQLDELLVGELMAAGELELVVEERPVSAKDRRIQAIADKSGWPISTANYNEELIRTLNGKIANESLQDITSIVVIKNGELLLEEYFNGAKRKTLHDTRSVGKSFVSTLIGMSIKDGYIENEASTLGDYFDLATFNNFSAAKNEVTLESLLTMSSGIGGSDFDSESASNEEMMYPTKNWLKFALDLPMGENKIVGKNWDYFTAGMIILADVMNQQIPGGLEKYAADHLFKSLGIDNYKWQYTAEQTVNTAGGLRLRALDLAKFGQLYRNAGQWNGQSIISSEWVDKTFTKYHELPMAKDNFYGYLFWNKTYQVAGEDHEVYYASGNGGNRIFIFKDQPLVVVITATAFNTPYGRTQADNIMQDYLLPAILGRTD